MELHPTSLHLETTATATGQSLVVGRPGHCRNFVTAAGAPHTTCQSHRPPQVVTTRNVSRYYSATTKSSPPVENHCSRERIKHLRRFQHRGTERRQDTCKSRQAPWQEAGGQPRCLQRPCQGPATVFSEGSALPCATGLLVLDATSPVPTPPTATKSPFCPENASFLPPGLADGVPWVCTPSPALPRGHTAPGSSLITAGVPGQAPLPPLKDPTPSPASPRPGCRSPLRAPFVASASASSHAAGWSLSRDRTQAAAFENRAVRTCKCWLNRGPEWPNPAVSKVEKAM